MKKSIVITTLALLAVPLLAAESPKEDVIAAAKKLAAADNYSWKLTSDFGPNSQFSPGPTEGKIEKDGLVWMTASGFQGNTMEGLMKGTNHIAVKTDEGWQSAAELGGGGGGGGGGFGNPGAFMVGRLRNLTAPATEAQELADKVKELKKDGDVYSGELTEAGAQSLLTFRFGGRRGGQAPPTPKDAKASVKFWVKDGMITKYETKATGKMEFQGEERDVERNNTVEIKDVGTTKISAPDDAKKKLS